MQGGWTGLFAIEKEKNAFETLKTNLMDGAAERFEWPPWLPREPHDIGHFVALYEPRLLALRGKVDLIVGGPPCQGFSSAGLRDPQDPRNQLFKKYLEMVRLVRPRLLLLENVRGFSVEFGKNKTAGPTRGRPPESFSDLLLRRLRRLGYRVSSELLNAADFGVPQKRVRFFVIGIHKNALSDGVLKPFTLVPSLKGAFLKSLGIASGSPISVADAISDVRADRAAGLIECPDSPGFEQIKYRKPTTHYQRQMHGSMNGTAPNSLRLAKHKQATMGRFSRLLNHARRGVTLTPAERTKFGVKKQPLVVLDGSLPSHTLTTLPDDYVHYAEPRILTVREYARIQSFPDWYKFQGVYTTGGDRRRTTCPRYSQVGNAVPPRLARFLGTLLRQVEESLADRGVRREDA